MNDFDNFCFELLEQAKQFREKAKKEKNPFGIKAYRHACLLITICSLEAYINGISEELTLAHGFPIHVKGVLLEKKVRLNKGVFEITNNLMMSRLTEKIEILYKRYCKKNLTDSETWWPILQNGIDLRNKLTHPKEKVELTDEFLEKLLLSIIECLSTLYKGVYKTSFPKHNLGLCSKHDF